MLVLDFTQHHQCTDSPNFKVQMHNMETKLFFANIYQAGQLDMYYNDNIWRRSMKRRQYSNIIVRIFNDHVIYRLAINNNNAIVDTVYQYNIRDI